MYTGDLFLRRPFGVEKEFFVQLFFEIDPKQSTLPSTEELIRKMFIEQQISFTSVSDGLKIMESLCTVSFTLLTLCVGVGPQ